MICQPKLLTLTWPGSLWTVQYESNWKDSLKGGQLFLEPEGGLNENGVSPHIPEY